MNASMDFMIRLFFLSYLIFYLLYYLIVVALLLAMFAFVLFYAALRSRSPCSFLDAAHSAAFYCSLLRLPYSSNSF